jgi:hypothetical protein
VRPGEPIPESPGLRYLIHSILRRDSLCPDGPRACIEAREVTCSACKTVHTPVDIRVPSESPCPNCGSRRYIRLACSTCPAEHLDQCIQFSGSQNLLDRTLMFDIALQKGFQITLADVTMEEFAALTILWGEQGKHQREEMEAHQRKLKEESNASSLRASYKTRPI